MVETGADFFTYRILLRFGSAGCAIVTKHGGCLNEFGGELRNYSNKSTLTHTELNRVNHILPKLAASLRALETELTWTELEKSLIPGYSPEIIMVKFNRSRNNLELASAAFEMGIGPILKNGAAVAVA